MKRVSEAENDFMKGFFKWLGSEDGQHSMEAVDYVFEALKEAGIDIAKRTIVWADDEMEQFESQINAWLVESENSLIK